MLRTEEEEEIDYENDVVYEPELEGRSHQHPRIRTMKDMLMVRQKMKKRKSKLCNGSLIRLALLPAYARTIITIDKGSKRCSLWLRVTSEVFSNLLLTYGFY